jgi:hypothetical protein
MAPKPVSAVRGTTRLAGARGTLVAAAALLLAMCSACAGLRGGSVTPVRLSELTDEGDPARRASLRLVEQGLAADAASQGLRAVGEYERAVQIDPTNPWVYLAMARHAVSDDPERALQYLDQAEALLDSEGLLSPRVEPHLNGLRGEALRSMGRDVEGAALIADAQALAPEVWADGHLSADELL